MTQKKSIQTLSSLASAPSLIHALSRLSSECTVRDFFLNYSIEGKMMVHEYKCKTCQTHFAMNIQAKMPSCPICWCGCNVISGGYKWEILSELYPEPKEAEKEE